MTHRHKIILLPPNRVWRTYPGGRTLARLAGAPTPVDSHLAEDWIASTTRAVNPGRENIPEGVSQVRVGLDPTPHDFPQLLAADPEYFLGAAHVKKYGAQPQLLVKFLDSGTRLHFQVHPSREFAQRVLKAPSGKTEAYYVLAVRDSEPERGPAASPLVTRHAPVETTGCIYVGFQRPPKPSDLRDYIATQNIAAIEACFDKIPVRAGDTFIIPGGTPHALGAGVFMVEIQEPSDLVIRFEFERAGQTLPESARFMNRDIDFALTVFNLTPLTGVDLEQQVRCRPRRIREFGPGSWQEELIGIAQTDCFRVARTRLGGEVVKDENRAVIAVVTAGTVTARVAGMAYRFDTYEKFFLPAGIGPVTFTPTPHAEMLECFPPV